MRRKKADALRHLMLLCAASCYLILPLRDVAAARENRCVFTESAPIWRVRRLPSAWRECGVKIRQAPCESCRCERLCDAMICGAACHDERGGVMVREAPYWRDDGTRARSEAAAPCAIAAPPQMRATPHRIMLCERHRCCSAMRTPFIRAVQHEFLKDH